jgi:hypothetical protein
MVDRVTQSPLQQTQPFSKDSLKRLLGELPLAAEAYWQLRQRGEAPVKSFSMHRIAKRLPEIYAQVEIARSENSKNLPPQAGAIS